MINDAWFRGRVALVTGASSGIGRQLAVALSTAGACVGINYHRNRGGAEALHAEIKATCGRSALFQADVSESDQVKQMFSQLENTFGDRLDMLVNNAGQWMEKHPIVECSEAQWDTMHNVNVKSVFLCCRQAAASMIRQGHGAILNIGSVAGHTGGGGGTVPYAAAKAAVHTFTRGLAHELGPHGIRVNAIAPGVIDTPMIAGRISPDGQMKIKGMTPLGRYGKPDEVIPTALLLLSPASSFLTGQVIDLNGGLLMR